jgi:hypothetical protein
MAYLVIVIRASLLNKKKYELPASEYAQYFYISKLLNMDL